MATTRQNIINTIRAALIVEAEQVFYGFNDQKAPPYIAVSDYEAVLTYDTGGPALRDSTFTVLVVDKSADNAEAIATQVDELLNTSKTVTPQTIGCFQESYKVGNIENLYQFGVEMRYSLNESLN